MRVEGAAVGVDVGAVSGIGARLAQNAGAIVPRCVGVVSGLVGLKLRVVRVIICVVEQLRIFFSPRTKGLHCTIGI